MLSPVHQLRIAITLCAASALAVAKVGSAASDGSLLQRDPGIVAGPMVVRVSAGPATLIHAPSGAGFRVLLPVSGLAEMAGTTVFTARLELPGLRLAEPLALETFPLTTAWSAGSVGWEVPWRLPGGDFDAVRGVHTQAGPAGESGDPLRMNVTSAIRAIVNERADDFGLIVMPSRRVAGGPPALGIPEALAGQFESLTGAQLVVFCAFP